jgi:hypothetical protein
VEFLVVGEGMDFRGAGKILGGFEDALFFQVGFDVLTHRERRELKAEHAAAGNA